MGKVRKPLIVGALNEETKSYLLVGLPGRHSGEVFKAKYITNNTLTLTPTLCVFKNDWHPIFISLCFTHPKFLSVSFPRCLLKQPIEQNLVSLTTILTHKL
jgi:hypothetical protein